MKCTIRKICKLFEVYEVAYRNYEWNMLSHLLAFMYFVSLSIIEIINIFKVITFMFSISVLIRCRTFNLV